MRSFDYTYNPFQFKPLAVLPKPLTDEWRRWIAENKMLGASDRSLLQTLVMNGIDPELARQELEAVLAHPYFQAGRNIGMSVRKLESHLNIRDQLKELSPIQTQIDRRSNLSRQEFLGAYYSTGTPVIITDVMQNWRAMSAWNPDYLREQFGDLEVEIQANRNADPRYEVNSEHHKDKVQMRSYVDMVVNGGETNDYYMVASNHHVNNQVLQAVFDHIEMFPAYLDPNLAEDRAFFWFGPKGTITPLHHDPTNLMMAQVVGTKRWKTISPLQTHLMYNHTGVFSEVDAENPDYQKYPLYQRARVFEFDLHPGEVIFMPVGWWHHVRSLDICISMSFTNFVFPNAYEWDYPQITR